MRRGRYDASVNLTPGEGAKDSAQSKNGHVYLVRVNPSDLEYEQISGTYFNYQIGSSPAFMVQI